MKKFFVMALVVLGMSVVSCGHKTGDTDETLGVSVDSTEVVVDTVMGDSVVVDSIVEVVDTL